ncbi:GNAT family N-acetyltransferase [Enterococcus columbae]|uniref:N-acetyltransferase domain-containing protein n=1 Tax=Enterococcus columbae DSM 7374 = ATCC 51263 TaxID=1121865 RepID=S1NIS8_9ENTE|nr:GNAT family N-acetyltransferase [Enterococcus columbae]EOT39584.1 hypothetical protein OMW_01884 [Enterococcus columbae DSM 7374 = ATCC 51263]EOW80111.1 hypothetical protein I568_02190 [Enterococcus columbae DSM 7374 = ATCC 51263]OJG22805.1 hypothetical protein RR47_GL000707 [Enterococcus columbae DSM 7374 = ATCC 51263]
MDYITETLETKRLILRPLSVNDATEMFNNWASDPQVTKYLTWSAHTNESTTKDRLVLRETKYKNKEILDWGIVVKETNELIGTITVVKDHPEYQTMEIGYVIGRKWWHQGYTTEAFRQIIQYLFATYPWLNRIEATHDIENPNSGKVMQKCGLQFEGILRQKGKNRRGLVDIAIYAILREDGKFQK